MNVLERATKCPIVLAHGFDASTTNRWSFYRVEEELTKKLEQVVVLASVQPYNSSEARAKLLGHAVDEAIRVHCKDRSPEDRKVNIIAHSMGGIDARFLISTLRYGDRVASLTTISTPHQGSRIADTLLSLAPKNMAPVDAIASVWAQSFTAKELAEDADVRAALQSIAVGNAANVDNATPDDRHVYYQSWAGVATVTGYAGADDPECDRAFLNDPSRRAILDQSLVAGALFVAPGGEANDGMVTVKSAKAPSGRLSTEGGAWNFQGCIPADHLGEVGQPKRNGADAWTGFDHVAFYRMIAASLAEKGF